MERRLIMSIETSCDETSVAIIENGSKILSNKVFTQISIHQKFGGVVPEIASRHHVEAITIVIEEAMTEAKITFNDINAICVTKGPGLIGSLLVGIQAAKALAFAYNIPLIGVHHIAGHIYANQFVKPMQFPLLALVVSGGHTELVLMKDHLDFEILGETLDDAVGEAYDKVARVLNLPYPGGPQIDKLAHIGKDVYNLPRAMMNEAHYNFSFSGIKSAIINLVHNCKQRNEDIVPEDLAASFQTCAIDILANKTFKAAREYNVKQIIVAGGVAANKGLRERFTEDIKNLENVDLIFPPMSLCTDNAAMIGAVGDILYQKKCYNGLDLNGYPSLDLE